MKNNGYAYRLIIHETTNHCVQFIQKQNDRKTANGTKIKKSLIKTFTDSPQHNKFCRVWYSSY